MTEQAQSKQPDPGPLMALSTAYWGAQTLLTANRIGLFALLGDGSIMTPPEVAASLGTAERPTRLLLQACVGLGLVVKIGEGFGNSATSAAFLVPGKPSYLGNALRYSDDLYATWGELETSLRRDAPALPAESYLGRDQDQTRHFVHGMHNRALAVGQALVGLIDLGPRQRMLDIGGGPGTYSALFTSRFPQLRSILLDLPDVVAIADEILASMGVTDRVETLAGDYHATAFPPGNEVVLISGVLHRESEADCRILIERATAALEPDGMLIVSDLFTDESGVQPPFATLFGLNMLLTAPNGGVHRDTDVAHWMRAAGVADVQTILFPPPMPHRALVGIKSPV